METTGYFRLKDVLQIVPVSKRTWFTGVNSGLYPKGSLISPRSRGYLKTDIYKLVDDLNKA